MPALNFDNHFRDLFENSHDLIYFLDIDGTIKLVNPAWLSTLHYEWQEVAGTSIYEYVHPDYIAFYRAQREEVIQHDTLKEFEIPFVTKDHKIVFGEAQVGCSYQAGKPMYTRCVVKDVTIKKAAENKIIENEKRLQTFFESGPDAVIVIDEDQHILEWNNKAEVIFGFTKREIMGKTLAETIIPPQYRTAHIKGMHHFLQSGEGVVLNKTIEITALHKSGREFYISLSISNLLLNGKWLFIAFVADISERKNTEASLIRKEAELLQLKLMEQQKDEFISIASHELKTPVTTVKAYAQLALAICKDGEPEVLTHLGKLNQHIDKITFLLDELLDVSKINKGKLELSYTETELDVFLPEVLNSVQLITKDHKILLEHNARAKIKIDRIRMEQVIINLIGNAAKYSPGRDTILVNTEIKNSDLVVSFKDFGIGISPDDITKIFDRFYRAQQSSEAFKGLGIGLFVSSEIIRQHGGRMWAESEQGEGSTFYFTLPL